MALMIHSCTELLEQSFVSASKIPFRMSQKLDGSKHPICDTVVQCKIDLSEKYNVLIR